MLKTARNATHLYRLRVREQPLQEILALIGIAAGVALLFAVQVASTSVGGSLDQLADGVTGKASLEIAARGPDGMDQSVVAKVRRLPSVQGAAPIVEQRISVVGPSGSAPLTLIGVDERIKRIGGPLVRRFMAKRKDLKALGFYLTAPTAKKIGVATGSELTIEAGATKRTMILAGTLDTDQIGGLTESPVALAPLGTAQRLAGMQDHIHRVLIEPKTGPGIDTARDLRALVGDKLNVRASDTEVELLGKALQPDQQSSALFSVIAVVIGLLFAYNAMLLSIARRRRQMANLRLIGADRRTVLATLLVEALVLGLVASLAGLVAGDLLSRQVFQSTPQYLAAGFTIGEQRIVGFQTIALSVGGGLLAALMASIKPAIDLYRVEPAEAVLERESGDWKHDHRSGFGALWAGLAAVVASSALAFLWPVITPIAIVGLLAGLVLTMGHVLAWIVDAIKRVTRVRGGAGAAIAVNELAANPARATALALIAAGSMLALVSIGGTRLDLERGVHTLVSDYFSTNDLWVAPENKTNVFVTQQFNPSVPIEQLRLQPEIRAVDAARWTFLDLGRRRLLVVSRPPNDPRPIVRSQIIKGDYETATARIRAGGWVTLSTLVAEERGYKVGDPVVIPVPAGNLRFRLAAITANYGWPTGSIVMNTNDYRKAWNSESASAISLRLAAGTSLSEGKRIVTKALGPGSSLKVHSAKEMVEGRGQAFAQGLARIHQISMLVLGASILAIIAAMFAAVWQRRPRLASLRAIGMSSPQLYRTLFAETSLIVMLGGLAGLVFGFYGQFFASRWTFSMSGYQTPFEPAIEFGFVTLAEMIALAALATAGPAFLASRIAPNAGQSA